MAGAIPVPLRYARVCRDPRYRRRQPDWSAPAILSSLNREFEPLGDYVSKLGAVEQPYALWWNLIGFGDVGALRVGFGLTEAALNVFRPHAPIRAVFRHRTKHFRLSVRIPAMPIANSNLMAIRNPSDADHHRSEATLSCKYHRERVELESSPSSVCGVWVVGSGARGLRLSPFAPLNTVETNRVACAHELSFPVLLLRLRRIDSPCSSMR